jgi:uncharacterized membrane protein
MRPAMNMTPVGTVMPGTTIRPGDGVLPKKDALPDGTGRGQRFGAMAMVGIVVLGLALRLWRLGAPSLWNDELFTRYYAAAGLRFLWTTGFGIETTPPTYYTLLMGWMKLAGTSEFALRLPSVIASTLAIPLVGLLGRDAGGWGCGLLAALIFAVCPMELYYAQEARAYAFMLLPLAAMLWCGVHLLRDLDARQRYPHPAQQTRHQNRLPQA